LPNYKVGRNCFPFPHLLQEERGTSVMALIPEIARPIWVHVSGICRTGLPTDNDPIDAAPQPLSQIKLLQQWRDR
jgi:hypothetical protein